MALNVNLEMLPNSTKGVGELVEVSDGLGTADRSVQPHPELVAARKENSLAKNKFDTLTPSAQKEMLRYISYLKTEESIEKNVHKAIQFFEIFNIVYR